MSAAASLAPKQEAEAYLKKTAEVNERVREVTLKIKTIELPYRNQLLPNKYKRFPQNVQDAINTPEEKRTPGQVLLANQVIRTVNVSTAEIDRIIKPEDLAARRKLEAEIKNWTRFIDAKGIKAE